MKVPCLVEGYDSILKMRRPNGASPTWYLKELNTLNFPGPLAPSQFLDVHSEFKRGYERDYYEEIPLDNKNGAISDYDAQNSKYAVTKLSNCVEYIEYSQVGDRKYIYPIKMWCGDFFVVHKDIGFSCIDNRVKEDVRRGKCLILIEYTSEPHSWSDVDQYKYIERWRIKENFPRYSVAFFSGNLKTEEIIKERNYGLLGKGISTFEATLRPPEEVSEFNPIDNKNLFLNYNRMPRCHRYLMIYKLLESNLINRGLVSYGNSIFPPDGYRVIDNVLHYRKSLDSYFENEPILSLNPELVNIIENTEFVIDNQDLLMNQALTPLIKRDYDRTFLSLVSETNSNKEIIFFSEKIWKPILMKHPFIIMGNPFSIKKLKELGYKTFDRWWDESYDTETNDLKRTDLIIEQLKILATKSVDELFIIRKEIQEVLDFNHEHFFTEKQKYHDYPRFDPAPIGQPLEELYLKFCNEKKNLI